MYPDYLVHFNPNHDPKTGQFAPGNGSSSISGKIGSRLKKADLLETDSKGWNDYKNKTGTYKRLMDASVTGMKAMAKTGDPEPWEEFVKHPEQHWEDWFLFEDQTFGMPQIADLANKGKTKEEIKQIIKDCVEYQKEDMYTDIPGVWPLAEWDVSSAYYTINDDKYIDACIEAAKENRQVKHSGVTKFGNYLCHYNKNHSPKNGQFTSGDGDGDSIRDDHHNYKKNKVTSSQLIKYDDQVHNPVDMKKKEIEKYQDNLRRVNKVRDKYDEDFNNSTEGKKLKKELEEVRKEYEKYWRKFYDYFDGVDEKGNINFSDKEFGKKYIELTKKFDDVYFNYYKTKGSEVCKNMLKELSEYDVASYSLGWDRPIMAKNTDELIKSFSETYWSTYPDKEDSPW